MYTGNWSIVSLPKFHNGYIPLRFMVTCQNLVCCSLIRFFRYNQAINRLVSILCIELSTLWRSSEMFQLVPNGWWAWMWAYLARLPLIRPCQWFRTSWNLTSLKESTKITIDNLLVIIFCVQTTYFQLCFNICQQEKRLSNQIAIVSNNGKYIWNI